MVIILTMHIRIDLNEVLTAADAGAEAAAIPQNPGGMIVSSRLVNYHYLRDAYQ